MKKFLATLTMVIGSIAAFDAAAAEWRLGVLTPPGQIWTIESIRFAEDIAKATEQRHSVRVHHSAQLGNEAQMLRQMQQGSLDFLLITASELANNLDAFNMVLAPGLARSNQHAADILAEAEEPQELLGLLENQLGVRGLAWGMGGNMQVITNFAADGPEDLRGRKIRIIPSPATRDFNTILGTSPMPITLPGVYDAFANGQVNAVELNFDVIRVIGLHEHGKNLLITNQTMNPGVVLVATRLWRTLSDDNKEIVQNAALDYGKRLRDNTVAAEAKSRKVIEDFGLKLTEVPRAELADAIAKWDERWVPKVPQIEALRKQADALADR